MLEIKLLTDHEQLEQLLINSDQGSIFSSVRWMSLFDDPFRIYGCYRGEELVGGIAGFEQGNCFISGNYQFTPYQGIVLKKISDKPSTMESLGMQVCEGLIKTLSELYNDVIICNHWSFCDIRPFLWDKIEWKPFVKYTYLLDMRDTEKAWDRLEKDTRWDIKNGVGVTWVSLDRFKELYQLTFQRKGLEVPTTDEFFDKFVKTIKPTLLGNEHTAAFFIKDDKRVYYIFGASDNGSSARVLWEAFSTFKGEIDMTGCNLPEIAHYKHGFGGELKTLIGVTNV